MARVTYVKKAQQRFETRPVIDPETGQQKVTPVLRKDGTPKMTRAKNGRPARPITMRVTEADKSKPKPNLVCEKCRTEIVPGMPYKHITPKSGPYGGRQRNRCMDCPGWRPSETTGSQHLATIYAAQEAADDALGQWDPEEGHEALQQILTDLAEGIREAAESYRESATNIEDGFGHETSMSEELNEKADAVESAADEIESAADDIEEFDEDAVQGEAETDNPEIDEDEVRTEIEMDMPNDSAEDIATAVAQAIADREQEREDAIEEAITEARGEWADEQRSKVEEAMSTDVGV